MIVIGRTYCHRVNRFAHLVEHFTKVVVPLGTGKFLFHTF